MPAGNGFRVSEIKIGLLAGDVNLTENAIYISTAEDSSKNINNVLAIRAQKGYVPP
ncbi:hypothetical protein D1AOALGA4SA_7462 [Olavius algarvensis Delta 1 endosymbiont]|nr:hypothetical protein D1AOALGA4SA_7462 [Olavius algarvensis Delta 1 endosymbiont]